MNSQNLIIYKYNSLYHILDELSLDFNFNIFCIEDEDSYKDKITKISNYLIISTENLNNSNQLFLDNLPINIFKLIEKINIEFLKIQFNIQSQLKINSYIIDLNSREMLSNNTKLKLTEKEIDTITFLSKENKPVSVDKLQKSVWSYQSDIETHTVETHIYRLRKKISNTFNDSKFILSKKNGYQIK